jgi:SAM-dependent methyltransferase
MSSHECPSCGRGQMDVFYSIPSVPTNSCLLLASPQEAIDYPRGDIQLGFCALCGFISNVAFQQALTEYSGRYEETQGFSSTFNDFHKRLAETLIERHKLRSKHIIEIGCGKGEFLHLICELGQNSGLGFDPGYIEGRIRSVDSSFQVIKDFYSQKYADYKGDFLCCKMTLEHISNTSDLVLATRHAVDHKGNAVAFFQVPESTRIFRDCAFEDIYYEHCSYFTPGSLARLFRRCGFDVLRLETAYDDQYLMIEARRRAYAAPQSLPLSQEDDLEALRTYVGTFRARCQKKVDHWRSRLSELHRHHQRLVLWGSGSKAVAFLAALGARPDINYVIDVNPHRWGFFMPGTGQEIMSPEFLQRYQPNAVIVMNRIYRNEITEQLKTMGLTPKILVL